MKRLRALGSGGSGERRGQEYSTYSRASDPPESSSSRALEREVIQLRAIVKHRESKIRYLERVLEHLKADGERDKLIAMASVAQAVNARMVSVHHPDPIPAFTGSHSRN